MWKSGLVYKWEVNDEINYKYENKLIKENGFREQERMEKEEEYVEVCTHIY